jgi:hypothetical protein
VRAGKQPDRLQEGRQRSRLARRGSARRRGRRDRPLPARGPTGKPSSQVEPLRASATKRRSRRRRSRWSQAPSGTTPPRRGAATTNFQGWCRSCHKIRKRGVSRQGAPGTEAESKPGGAAPDLGIEVPTEPDLSRRGKMVEPVPDLASVPPGVLGRPVHRSPTRARVYRPRATGTNPPTSLQGRLPPCGDEPGMHYAALPSSISRTA